MIERRNPPATVTSEPPRSTPQTAIALNRLREAAAGVHTVAMCEQRADLEIAALLVGELVTALGVLRADADDLSRMLDVVTEWTASPNTTSVCGRP